MYKNQWNQTPQPQPEPQITRLDKCKINWIILETPVYYISGVWVGGSFSIGGVIEAGCYPGGGRVGGVTEYVFLLNPPPLPRWGL